MVKLLSLNVKGSNSPTKRKLIMTELRKQHVDIAFLQETHHASHTPHLALKHYPQVYASNNPQKKATGVMTLIHKDLPFKLQDKLTDVEGRFVFLKGQIAELKVTIANVYAPNEAQLSFMHKTLSKLEMFKEGLLVLGGDLNVMLNPILDSSSKKSPISYKGLKILKQKLAAARLIDTWRIMHPKNKD
uniref:exodeoxyribonuclease III n=1 Tax=Xenopus tropicalis TaxID=8364 RepID=A0A803JZJ7_XENTR